MMWEKLVWHTEPNGALAAEIDGVRLVVQGPAEVGGYVRFTVLRRQYRQGSLLALIGSGTRESVGEAMSAAERMVGSCRKHGPRRPVPTPELGAMRVGAGR